MEAYGSRFIAATFGIPVSSLHYWDRTGLLKPSVRPAAGRGSKRLYSFRDVVQLVVVSNLREMKVSLQRIRGCLRFLRRSFPELEAPLAELALLTDGESVFVLTDSPDKVLDTLREQMVWSLPISAWLRSARETVDRASAPSKETVEVDGTAFTVKIEQDPEDGWWVGLVEELPGCGSQGSTLEELRRMVVGAISDYLAVQGEVGEHGEEAAQASAV